MSRWVTAGVASAVAIVGGCGSDSDADSGSDAGTPVAAMQSFVDAVAAGDFESACALFSVAERETAAERSGGTCEDDLASLTAEDRAAYGGVTDIEQVDPADEAEEVGVTVLVTFPGDAGVGEFHLIEKDGEWRVQSAFN